MAKIRQLVHVFVNIWEDQEAEEEKQTDGQKKLHVKSSLSQSMFDPRKVR